MGTDREDVKLVVQADDFGMCHAVNAGVALAFAEGIVQQASLMAPCPWFPEAASLAVSLRMPVGVHLTLTCEWDHLRWRPLTDGRSLAAPDGTMPTTVHAVAERATDHEATAELLAQAERVAAAGLTVSYLDVHMGLSKPAAYEAVAGKLGAPFLYPGLEASLSFASIFQMSAFEAEAKRDKLLRRLERIAQTPGVHLIVAHPAVTSEELRSMTSAGAHNAVWTEPYRVSDLQLLCSPEVRTLVDDLGIRLCSVAEAFS